VDREQLRIAGLTGVDITLDIAGVGSRSYAFIIDWHIRLLAALAWIAVTAMLVVAHIIGPHANNPLRMFFVWVPALCIYFLYHPVLEMALQGRTPGKRMAGVRLVTRSGATPSLGALFVRNLFRLIDSLPSLYVIGLLTCLLTEQRVRFGDMAAGTLLVLDAPAAARSLAQIGSRVADTGLPPDVIELVEDVLARWDSLDTDRRSALARTILSRVDKSQSPETLAAVADRDLHSRLRWLVTASS
jgi:uncharacterized RDD family membrane protein YckC